MSAAVAAAARAEKQLQEVHQELGRCVCVFLKPAPPNGDGLQPNSDDLQPDNPIPLIINTAPPPPY